MITLHVERWLAIGAVVLAEVKAQQEACGVIPSITLAGMLDEPTCRDTTLQETQEHSTPGASCVLPAKTLPRPRQMMSGQPWSDLSDWDADRPGRTDAART